MEHMGGEARGGQVCSEHCVPEEKGKACPVVGSSLGDSLFKVLLVPAIMSAGGLCFIFSVVTWLLPLALNSYIQRTWGSVDPCTGRDMELIKEIEQERAKCSWKHKAPVIH